MATQKYPSHPTHLATAMAGFAAAVIAGLLFIGSSPTRATPTAEANRPTQAEDQTAADQAKPRWSKIISADTLDAEIRDIHQTLEKDLRSPDQYRQGGHKIVRLHYGVLAVLMAITAQHDGQVKYRESAATASVRFSAAALNAKVATAQSYELARQCLRDLSTMLSGGKLPVAPAQIDWSRVADRSALMQHLAFVDREVFSKLADEELTKENRELIRRHAEAVAAVGAVLCQQGMPEADDDEYTKYAQELTDQTRQLAEFAAQNDQPQAAKMLGKIHAQCAQCHEGYRS